MIKVKSVYIPRWVKRLPENIIDELIGRKGGYRMQNVMIRDTKKKWGIWVDEIFNARKGHGLETTGQFAKALEGHPTKYKVDFSVRPCFSQEDGYPYHLSLMYGRDEIPGRRYLGYFDSRKDFSIERSGAFISGTGTENYDLLMIKMREYLRSRSVREKWFRSAMRAVKRNVKNV